MQNETAGTKALKWINEMIQSGKTVYISTMTNVTSVSAKTVKAFEKSGHPLFKIVDGNLFIASGKRFNKLTLGDVALVGFKAL